MKSCAGRREWKYGAISGQYSLLLDVPTEAVVDFTVVGESVVLDSWPQPPKEW